MPAGTDRMERVRADLLRRAQAREDMASTRQQQDASYSFAMGAAVPAPLSLGPRNGSPLPDAIANYRQDKPPPRFPAPHPDFAVHGRSLTQQRSLDIVRVGGSGNPGTRSGSVPPDAERGRSSFSSENPGRRGVKVPFALSRDGQNPPRRGRQPHAREAPAVRPVYERNIPIRQVRLPDPPTRAFVRSKLRDVELGDTDTYLPEKGAATSPKKRKFLFCIPWPESRKVRTALLQSLVSFIFLIGLLGVCKFCLLYIHSIAYSNMIFRCGRYSKRPIRQRPAYPVTRDYALLCRLLLLQLHPDVPSCAQPPSRHGQQQQQQQRCACSPLSPANVACDFFCRKLSKSWRKPLCIPAPSDQGDDAL